MIVFNLEFVAEVTYYLHLNFCWLEFGYLALSIG